MAYESTIHIQFLLQSLARALNTHVPARVVSDGGIIDIPDELTEDTWNMINSENYLRFLVAHATIEY